jgi:hypothetical protein
VLRRHVDEESASAARGARRADYEPEEDMRFTPSLLTARNAKLA